MLEIQKFVKENPNNWKELLSNSPYSLTIKTKDSRILFKYSQISSDPALEITKEARGLVLEDKTFNIIAYPFKRFFNYGEKCAADVDWDNSSVQTKEDGSLIKVYFYNEWKVGTSGTIDASDAPLGSGKYKTYRELFDLAAQSSNLDFDRLDPHFTYMFELVSPFDPHVCPHTETKLIHIGTRDNRTLEEIQIDIGVEKPKTFRLNNLKECLDMVKTFDFTKEGFVVCDNKYNRIKIKSEDYLKVHRLKGNNSVNNLKIFSILRQHEESEFLSYFPYYKKDFEEVQRKLSILEKEFSLLKEWCLTREELSQKDFSAALQNLAKEKGKQWIMFAGFAMRRGNFSELINKFSDKKFLETFSLKEE